MNLGIHRDYGGGVRIWDSIRIISGNFNLNEITMQKTRMGNGMQSGAIWCFHVMKEIRPSCHTKETV